MRILVIEDEEKLADVIKERLKQAHYEVDICLDGQEGLYYATNGNYDLILLDVMLPNLNGFEILKVLRKQNCSSKIIMLTAKSMIEDKLEGLENGANDYLTKPFHYEELLARVRIQLNQTALNHQDIIEYDDLVLNQKTCCLMCKTSRQEVELVRKEYLIVEYFMQNPSQILSKEQIYDKVWGMDSNAESNNLAAYLSFVRKKLKAIDSKVIIKAYRGLGYKLEVSHG